MPIGIADVREGGWSPHRARRQDIASILKSIFLFIRASFQNYPLSLWERDQVRENKNSFIHIRDEGIPPRYHPAYVQTCERHFDRDNGLARRWLPAVFFRVYQRSLLLSEVEGDNRRVQSWYWHSRSMPLKGFHLALPSR